MSALDQQWASAVAGLPCGERVLTQIRTWSAGVDSRRAPPTGEGRVQYRLPTGVIGEWVILDIDGGTPPRLTRVGPVVREHVEFDARCGVVTTTETAAAPGRSGVGSEAGTGSSSGAGAVFSDLDVSQTIDDAPEGVILYLWSPHMPLSVDGYPEVVSAGAAREFVVVPILLPGADHAFAVREADRVGIPAAGLRVAASVELAMRDAYVHAPTIVAVRAGRWSVTLPGYRNAAGYEDFLDDFLLGQP